MPRRSAPKNNSLSTDNAVAEHAGTVSMEETTTPSGRPRRNARKNVLYSHEDYDLQLSGPLMGGPPDKTTTSFRGQKPPVLVSEEPRSLGGGKREAVEMTMLKGAKRRKIPPHVAEMMEAEEKVNVCLDNKNFEQTGTPEVEDGYNNDQNDDGPPVLGPSAAYTEDTFGETDYNDDANVDPPNLERHPLSKKRGRPRRQPEQDAVRVKLTRPNIRVGRPPVDLAARIANPNQRNIKLFEEELDTTPGGDTYATVVNGCLTELLRKERIIDLLTNPAEIELIRRAGWFLPRPPRLPPLTTEKACFAFYVDGSTQKNAKDLSNDDLRPWSVTNDNHGGNGPSTIKPNVRRHPVARLNGEFKTVKHETQLAELHLTEYSARLPREQRLRKKIFYLTRDNTIYGNVLILYDYVNPGNAPVPVCLPHGNDLLRGAAVDDQDDGVDNDLPFESHFHAGARGSGVYLKLRSNKLGWAQNKKQLLDYLYNKCEILDQLGAINNRLPDLPPLIQTVGVYVYFVASGSVQNQIHHAADGLSPWTTNPGGEGNSTVRVRSTRRSLAVDTNGELMLAPDQKGQSELVLVETMSTLARCKRVRKRVFYIQQPTALIIGNVCYTYEFVTEGPLPSVYPPLDKSYNSNARWENSPNKKPDSSIEMPSHILGDQEAYDELVAIEDDGIVDVIDVHKDIRGHHHHHHHQEEDPQLMSIPPYPDTMNNGFDPEFNDDPIDKAENPEPYYDEARQLSTGHVFLTVRHKKVVTSLDHVLTWISNSNHVEERGILNESKPLHPPLVTNSRAYAFFVAATAIFPHDINRDDFSPWSRNGTPDNPTCYRTKVRKLGVTCDPHTSAFVLKENADYKNCPFHLVYLYSINPKDPRLRKKIYYLMETQSKMVVSHALIMYDYNNEGTIPRLNSGQYKTHPKKSLVRNNVIQHDLYNDVTDHEERCPFVLPPETAPDGTFYVTLNDQDFWNDRNRQINYLANNFELVHQMGCLNNRVPDLPPPCVGKGTFAFFINGEEVNFRSLTVDKLTPWSENVCTNPHGITKRPKSAKTPLGLNRQNQLRVWKSSAGISNEQAEFQLHVYTATLPRCVRLRKKVVYVQRDGVQYGNGLIMYCYTEPGEVPQPLIKNMLNTEEYVNSLSQNIQDDIYDLLKSMSAYDVVKCIHDTHGVHLNVSMVHNIRQRLIREGHIDGGIYETEWAGDAGPSTSSKMEAVEEQLIEEEEIPKAIMDHELMVEDDMIVGHTEVIENDMVYESPMVRRNPFFEKSVATAGFVRGSQRNEALWRIAQKQFGAESMNDTFDKLFRLLYEKNEQRLLQMVNTTFSVNIMAAEEQVIEEEAVEYIQEDELDHHGNPDLSHMPEHADHHTLPAHAEHHTMDIHQGLEHVEHLSDEQIHLENIEVVQDVVVSEVNVIEDEAQLDQP